MLEKRKLGLRCGSRLPQLPWIRPGADDEEEELPEFDFEKDLSIMEQPGYAMSIWICS